MACIAASQKKAAEDLCLRRPLMERPLCLSKIVVCPDVSAPTVDATASPITLLGVYQICSPQPTTLAPYPPTTPLPLEAQAEARLEALTTQVKKASSLDLVLRSRAEKARKIEVGWGFYAGLGLCGVGIAALYLTRR